MYSNKNDSKKSTVDLKSLSIFEKDKSFDFKIETSESLEEIKETKGDIQNKSNHELYKYDPFIEKKKSVPYLQSQMKYLNAAS